MYTVRPAVFITKSITATWKSLWLSSALQGQPAWCNVPAASSTLLPVNVHRSHPEQIPQCSLLAVVPPSLWWQGESLVRRLHCHPPRHRRLASHLVLGRQSRPPSHRQQFLLSGSRHPWWRSRPTTHPPTTCRNQGAPARHLRLPMSLPPWSHTVQSTL